MKNTIDRILIRFPNGRTAFIIQGNLPIIDLNRNSAESVPGLMRDTRAALKNCFEKLLGETVEVGFEGVDWGEQEHNTEITGVNDAEH